MNQYDKSLVRFYQPNQIHPELLGTAAINFAPYKVSSPRLHMLAAHMGQKPPLIHGEPPLIYTTVERAHAEFLYSISTDTNIIIKEVLHRFPDLAQYGDNPPESILVFERQDTGEIDILTIPYKYCNHQTFGFKYERTEAMERAYTGQMLPEGTLLAKPPTLNDTGDWCFGRNVRMGLIPSEPGIEDGLCISESTAKKFAMYGYGKVEMSFGKNKIPLNTYGDENTYIPFPKIGDVIKPSGVIMFGRNFDARLAPANMSRNALNRPNNTDESVFGVPGAVITDIKLIRGFNQSTNLPEEIDRYFMMFHEKQQAFHRSVLRLHKTLSRERGTNRYPMTPNWYSIIKNATFATDAKGKIKRETHRGSVLDDYRLTIEYQYIYIPNKGAKFTGRQGDKAVVTKIRPDNEMPMDHKGRHLDAYMDDSSTSNRMNGTRLDEIVINSCMETAVEEIRTAYLNKGVEAAWAILREALSFVSPLSIQAMDKITDPAMMAADIEEIIADPSSVPRGHVAGIRVALPPDNPVDYIRAIPALSERFPPCYGPLLLTNEDGTKVLTKYSSITGMSYVIPLDRQANKFAATASSRRQCHAIAVKPSKAARSQSPINDSPTRDKGEDETRGYASINGGNVIADNYDRNLNPEAHRQECRSIFAAANPSRITNTVPRFRHQIDPTVKRQKVIPVTGGRVVDIRDHVLRCGGTIFVAGEDGDSV